MSTTEDDEKAASDLRERVAQGRGDTIEVEALARLFGVEPYPPGLSGWLRRRAGRAQLAPDDARSIELLLRAERVRTVPPLPDHRSGRSVLLVLDDERPSRWRVAGRRAWGSLVSIGVVVGVAASMVAFVPYLIDDSPPQRSPLTGDLNVVVAPFAGSSAADSVARKLTAQLEKELRVTTKDGTQPLDVQVAGPDGLGVIGGGSDTRTLAAQRIAQQRNADVVMYGEVVGSRIRIYVSITVERLRYAEELSGEYELVTVALGTRPLDKATGTRIELRAKTTQALSALSALLIGLASFRDGHVADAVRWFARSGRRGRESTDISALAALFEGNAAGWMNDYRRAQRAYERASRLRAGWPRPALGLAEVALQRAQHGCGVSASRSGLRRARRRFDALLRAAQTGGLIARAIQIRSRLGSARADVCLSQAGLEDRWLSAEAKLKAALALMGNPPRRFSSEAAMAHATLGLVYLPVKAGAGPVDASSRKRSLLRARAEYAAALTLVGDPNGIDDRQSRETYQRFVRYIDRQLAVPARRSR